MALMQDFVIVHNLKKRLENCYAEWVTYNNSQFKSRNKGVTLDNVINDSFNSQHVYNMFQLKLQS